MDCLIALGAARRPAYIAGQAGRDTDISGLQGFVDRQRSVLRMAGADVRDVLQNVVTNDIDRLAPGRALYAALLTPQGKYLFDFLLLEGPDGVLLIDVAADRAAALAQRLRIYCMPRHAAVTGAPGLVVARAWRGPATAGSPGGASVCPDPRAPPATEPEHGAAPRPNVPRRPTHGRA